VFYQLVVGAWPPELSAAAVEPATLDTFRRRIEGAMLKSMREAKLRTSWDAPDEAYEAAVVDFVRYALDGERTNPFLDSIRAFQARLAPLGIWNSLVQTVLKLTVPGVPDIYQGAELWDLSLVDPDSRRSVDFAARRDLLERARRKEEPTDRDRLQAMYAGWEDGAIKLQITASLLRMRQRHPGLFAQGSYEALSAEGPEADRTCAFMRRAGEMRLVVAALQFPARGMLRQDSEPTVISLPDDRHETRWTDLFSGQALKGRALTAARVFSSLPVAVLAEDIS
jgi:(1->4)-alpha-D-glucan 1-alpha-D-glucosylmutase